MARKQLVKAFNALNDEFDIATKSTTGGRKNLRDNDRHPLPEHIYDIYMQYWGDVTFK
ncbi:MAG: hypothetical protein ACXV48_00475 [Halobacteriota archaeon]